MGEKAVWSRATFFAGIAATGVAISLVAPVPDSAADGEKSAAKEPKKPAARKSRDVAPVPSAAAATPQPRTALSEHDEFAIEAMREGDLTTRAIWGDLAQIGWPVATIVALFLGADLGRRWMPRKAAPVLAPPTVAAERATMANTQFWMPTAEFLSMTDAVKRLLTEYGNFAAAQNLQPPAVIDMLAKPCPAGVPKSFVDAHEDVQRYSEKLVRVLLASQYALLRIAAARNLTHPEVMAMYSDANLAGFSAGFSAWLDFPLRTGMIETTSASGQTTIYALSHLGSMVLGWIDFKGYSRQFFDVAGRGI